MPHRLHRLALAVAVLLCCPLATAAAAGYVLFFQSFGDWATLCSRDEATGVTSCTADAPPPSLDGQPAVVVHVTEAEPGAFAVSVEFRANVAPNASAALRVDGGADHMAAMDRNYVAVLDRAASSSMVAEMLTGRLLTVRVAGFGSDAAPIYVGVPLTSFPTALERMRANLRQYGTIRDSR